MRGGAEDGRRRQLTEVVRATPGLMRVLETIRALDLPDWLVFSGAVYQAVLNHLTGRPADYGLNDYDVGYFDASDLSYEAEDRRHPPRRRRLRRAAAPDPSRGAQPGPRAPVVRAAFRRALRAALLHGRGVGAICLADVCGRRPPSNPNGGSSTSRPRSASPTSFALRLRPEPAPPDPRLRPHRSRRVRPLAGAGGPVEEK